MESVCAVVSSNWPRSGRRRAEGCSVSPSPTELPPILTGSHIDSQPEGGRFDGALGVMGALEVMRTLHDNDARTERSVMIVDWMNEEGSRFSPAMMSSGVWAGKLDRDWIYSRTDLQGKVLVDELERIGYRGSVPATSWPFYAATWKTWPAAWATRSITW